MANRAELQTTRTLDDICECSHPRGQHNIGGGGCGEHHEPDYALCRCRRFKLVLAGPSDENTELCRACGVPWILAEAHQTIMRCGMASILCEPCWLNLTPEQRLPFYKAIWDQWLRSALCWNWPAWQVLWLVEDAWPQMREAVLAGR